MIAAYSSWTTARISSQSTSTSSSIVDSEDMNRTYAVCDWQYLVFQIVRLRYIICQVKELCRGLRPTCVICAWASIPPLVATNLKVKMNMKCDQDCDRVGES
jgi:hypothetical protein